MSNDQNEIPIIRTIHHFACSGGTLISKSIASMPNVLLLSELDPLSPLSPLQEKHQKPEFSPSDPIKLLKHNLQVVGDDVLVSIFKASIADLYRHCKRLSYKLVLRDHSHSHYCCGERFKNRLSFLRMFSKDFDLKSIVTVRHPLESYVSLCNNGWVHFKPASFDEYCKRYHDFLDEYDGVEFLKYEDFTKSPDDAMKKVCNILDIEYDPSYIDYIAAIRLTGDSGRSSNVIDDRPRKAIAEGLRLEADNSESYQSLCNRLGYES